jgi:hypothetical protein
VTAFFSVDDEIVPQLRPEKDIWNLSNDDFYDPKAKADKSGKGGHGVLQHSTPGAAHYFLILIQFLTLRVIIYLNNEKRAVNCQKMI